MIIVATTSVGRRARLNFSHLPSERRFPSARAMVQLGSRFLVRARARVLEKSGAHIVSLISLVTSSRGVSAFALNSVLFFLHLDLLLRRGCIAQAL